MSADEAAQLLGAVRIRQLASELNLRPTKQRGQNFVVDANTVRRIVQLANVDADDVVLEVGPGLGSLTLGLLPQVNRVIAVEIDDVLAGALPKTISEQAPMLVDRLQIIHADALQVNSLDREPTALAKAVVSPELSAVRTASGTRGSGIARSPRSSSSLEYTLGVDNPPMAKANTQWNPPRTNTEVN